MSIDKSHVREPARWLTSASFILAGLLCVGLVGALFLKHHPTVGPDEFGFLINGQHLVTGAELPLAESMRSFYMVGYGFITAIATLIGRTMKAEYTISLAFNIGFLVLTGVVLNAFARRHLALSRAWSRVVTIAACLMPTLAANAMFSWSESLGRLCFVLLVFLVFEYSSRPTLRLGVSLAVLMAWMPVIHGRFTLVLPLVAIVIVVAGYSRESARRLTVVVSIATLALTYLLMRGINSAFRNDLYPGAIGKEGRVLRKIFEPENYRSILRALVSQSWYVAGTSLGIAVFGVLLFSSMARDGVLRRDVSRFTGPLFVLAASVMIFFTNTLQLIRVIRPDHLAYGRYPEVVTPILLTAGFALLLQRGHIARRMWWAGCLFVALLCVTLLAASGGDNLRTRIARGEYFAFANSIGLDVPKNLFAPMGYVSVSIFFVLLGVAFIGLFLLRREVGVALFIIVSLSSSTFTVVHTIIPRRVDATRLVLDDTIRSMTRAPKDAVVGFDPLANVQDFFDYRFQLHPIQATLTSVESDIPARINCVIAAQGRRLPPEWAIVDSEPGWGLELWKRTRVDSC